MLNYAGLVKGDVGNLPDDLSGINQIDLISSAEGKSARTEMVYEIANFQHTNLTTGYLKGIFGAALRFEDWKVLRGCVTLLECAMNSGSKNFQKIFLFICIFYLYHLQKHAAPEKKNCKNKNRFKNRHKGKKENKQTKMILERKKERERGHMYCT